MILGSKLKSYIIVNCPFCKKRSAFDFHKLIDESPDSLYRCLVTCPYCDDNIVIDLKSPQEYSFKDIFDN